MAVQDTRAVVSDPLGLNVGQTPPERSLQTTRIRNPQQQGDQTRFTEAKGILAAVGKFQGAIASALDAKKEDWQTEGKLQYMQGATEEQIAKNGNLYVKQGWEAMNTVDKANTWFLQESANIKESGYETDPETYRKGMMQRRAEFMKNLPNDPAIRKLYVAAFDDLGPRLVSTHSAAHNEYNKAQSGVNFDNMVKSGSKANSDATVREPGKPLALSPGQVRTVPKFDEEDVRYATKTVLGEAIGEGYEGQAAVVHNLLNRVQDGGFMGSTIKQVALAPKQYSAFNKGAGGNRLVDREKGDPTYDAAEAIVRTVLSGRHVDPTNGATHYYSPKGMKALVDSGAQPNSVPSWWSKVTQQSGGYVQIGGHLFAGRARNAPQNLAQADNPQAAPSETVPAEGPAEVHPEVLKKYRNTNDADLREIAESKASTPELKAEAQAVLNRRVGRRGTGDVETRPLGPLANPEQMDAQRGREDKQNPQVVEAKPGDNPVKTAAAIGVATRETPSGPTTQLRANVLASPLKAKEKGNRLAALIIQGLLDDDDQVFRDAGGVGFLQELGADASQISQVLRAKKQYDQKNQGKFSAAEQKWENDLYDRVDKGLSVDDANKELEARTRSGLMSDSRAQAIANKVRTDANKVDRQWNMSDEVMGTAQEIFQKTQRKNAAGQPELSIKDATELTRKLARDHNLPQNQIDTYIKALWNEQQSQFNTQQAEIARRAEEKKKQDAVLTQIGTAVQMGTGGDGLHGKIKTQNAKGQTEEIDAKQGLVRQIMTQEYAKANAEVETSVRNGIPESDARPVGDANAESRIYGQLNRHNVVNEGMSSTVSGALSGVIVGKGGKVTDDAEKAMDWYLRMRNDPNVGGAYADRYFKNEQSRDIAHSAAEFMTGGGMDLKEALAKAYELQQNKDKMPERTLVQNTSDFDQKFDKAWTEKEGEILGTTSVLGVRITSEWREVGWSGPKPVNDFSKSQAKHMIGKMAAIYQMENPAASDKVVIDKAMNDYTNNSFRVGNNLVYSKDAGRLDRKMGLEGFGKGAPQYATTLAIADYADAAVKAYREKAGKGDELGWGRYFYETKIGRGVDSVTDGIAGRDKRELPEFTTTYVPSTGQLYIYLPEKEGVKTKPLMIDVGKAGRDWKAYKKYGSAQDAESIFTTIGRGINRLAVAGSKAPDRPADLLNQELDNM